MIEPAPPATEPGRRTAGFGPVGIASIVAAAVGYGVLVVVARGLTVAQNSDFVVFWALLFGGFGVLGGIQTEATRAVGTVDRAPGERRGAARVMVPALGMALVLALVVAALSPVWRSAVLGGQPAWMVLVPCAAWVGYAGHLAVLGSLGGRRSWVGSALLVGGEPTLRFVLVLVVALLGSSLMGFEIASAASVVFWLGLLVVSSEARSAARARADAGWRVLVRRIGQAMIASSGSAVLVVAFPTLMRATTDAALWPAAAPLVMAINLTRAPLMLPLTALQGVIISHFLNATGRRSAALLRILGLVAAIGAVGTVGAYLLGPWLMTTFFGAEYHLSGGLLASLTAASVGLAALTVVGACVLATDRHAAFAAGWLLAAVVAVGVLLTPWDLQTRALVALAVAPVVGLVVHLVALRPMLTERRAGPVAAA